MKKWSSSFYHSRFSRHNQGADSEPSKQAPAPHPTHILGSFSVEKLLGEFEEEKQSCRDKLQQTLQGVTTRREKRLKKVEKNFLDVKHMEQMTRPAYTSEFPYCKEAKGLVEWVWFQHFFFFLVLLYSLVMGAELEFDDEKYATNWFRVNCLFCAAFFFEAFVKVYSYGHHYFFVPWWVLEFITLCGTLLSLSMYYRGSSDHYKNVFNALKVSRIIMLGKLFSLREEFQVIVVGFTRCVTQLWGVLFVLLVVCYGCTLFCFSVIGKHDYPNWPDHDTYFGSIPKTMMTLFSMVIVDEWAGYARAVYAEQPPVVLFFFIFTVLTTLGLLNVVTGMVVESVNGVSEDHALVKQAQKQGKLKTRLQGIIDAIFDDHGSALTQEDFVLHENRAELIDMISTVDFPQSFSLTDLFTALDSTGHREILKEQFVDGVMNYINGDIFQLDCQVLLSINKVFRDVISLRKEMRTVHHRTEHDFQHLDELEAEETHHKHHHVDGELDLDAEESLLMSLQDLGDFSVHALLREFDEARQAESEAQCLSQLPRGGTQSSHHHAAVGLEEIDHMKPAYVKRLPCNARITRIVEGKGFRGVFFFMVAVFSLVMGMELQYDSDKYKKRWLYLNGFFMMAFSTEALAKLLAYGHNYFRVPWFALEFATTAGSIMALGMDFMGMTGQFQKTAVIIKCSRIILIGKLFSLKDEFRIIVEGFTRSVYSLWGVIFVLVVVNYGCTLFCYSVIGKYDYSKSNPDHDLHWGSIPRTMITLFSTLIVDSWGQYAKPVYEEQPLVVCFFFLYTVMLSLGLLNVVTGMVVDTVTTVKKEHDRAKLNLIREDQKMQLGNVVNQVFKSSDQEITEDEFVNHSSKGELMEMLDIVDFPHNFTLRDFFTILDTTGHKTMLKGQFVDGLVMLINSNSFHRQCQIMLGIHKLRRGIVDLRKELASVHHRVQILQRRSKRACSLLEAAKAAANEEADPTSSQGTQVERTRTSQTVGQVERAKTSQTVGQVERFRTSQTVGQVERFRTSQTMGATASMGPQTSMALTRSPTAATVASRAKSNAALTRSTTAATVAPKALPGPFASASMKTGDHWERLRATLHAAAMEHCLEELELAWETLDEIRTGDRDHPMPSTATPGTDLSLLQERWYVWHKLYDAVSREDLHEMRQCLDHASTAGIDEKSHAILYTFCDAMSRHQRIVGVSLSEVTEALECGDWMRALDSVIEISMARGADKSLILNALARLCADSYGYSAWNPSGDSALTPGVQVPDSIAKPQDVMVSVAGLDSARGKALQSTIAPVATKDLRGRLVAVLHSEAAEHAQQEMKQAWQELEGAYQAANRNGISKGGFGPGYSPFSRQEEIFFFRNQINNAVAAESVQWLRRALSHALAFGMDIRTLEIEAAYCDALARHAQGAGFSPRSVVESLERGDWWSALDDIIGASFARGIDKHVLFKMIAKVCCSTVNFTPENVVASQGQSLEDKRLDFTRQGEQNTIIQRLAAADGRSLRPSTELTI